MILIIGAPDEAHSKYIYDKLIAKGEKPVYFDTKKIPNNLMISWNTSEKDFLKGYFLIEGNKLHFSDIKSVYWRNHFGYQQTLANNDYMLKYFIERDIQCSFDSLFSSSDWLWCNSLKAIELHKKKVFQLNQMAKNNIRVPDTLITNNKDDLLEFLEKNNNNVIFKPVLGGAYTKKLSKESLNSDLIKKLINSPVQFQEMIEGTDVRAYIVGKEVFAAKIETDILDFRTDKQAKIKPVELPQEIIDKCFKIMELFDLNYTGIDIRLSDSGEYVFLEANPAPMFIHFEKESGYPISDTLVKMLMR